MVCEAVRSHAQLLMDQVEAVEAIGRGRGRKRQQRQQREEEGEAISARRPYCSPSTSTRHIQFPPQESALADDLSTDSSGSGGGGGSDRDDSDEEGTASPLHLKTGILLQTPINRPTTKQTSHNSPPRTMVKTSFTTTIDESSSFPMPMMTRTIDREDNFLDQNGPYISSASSSLHNSNDINKIDDDDDDDDDRVEITRLRQSLDRCRQAVMEIEINKQIKIEKLELEIVMWKRRACRAESLLLQQQQQQQQYQVQREEWETPSARDDSQNNNTSNKGASPSTAIGQHQYQVELLTQQNYQLQEMLLKRCPVCQKRTSLGQIRKKLVLDDEQTIENQTNAITVERTMSTVNKESEYNDTGAQTGTKSIDRGALHQKARQLFLHSTCGGDDDDDHHHHRGEENHTKMHVEEKNITTTITTTTTRQLQESKDAGTTDADPERSKRNVRERQQQSRTTTPSAVKSPHPPSSSILHKSARQLLEQMTNGNNRRYITPQRKPSLSKYSTASSSSCTAEDVSPALSQVTLSTVTTDSSSLDDSLPRELTFTAAKTP